MLHLLLVALAVVLAIQAIRSKRLLASALWLAGTSAILSILLYRMAAYKVAVIELSVGAGLVTVLFVFAINIAGDEAMDEKSLLSRPVAWVLIVALVLLLGVLILPLAGAKAAVSETSFAVVLWQQRGLDVLVQVVLIFAGVLGLLGLLAEAKAPLQQPVAEAVAARREHELAMMQQQALDKEKEIV